MSFVPEELQPQFTLLGRLATTLHGYSGMADDIDAVLSAAALEAFQKRASEDSRSIYILWFFCRAPDS